MNTESRVGQIELKTRGNDFIPFVDQAVIKGAARAIRDGMCGIRSRAGEIVYPYPLSSREIGGVLREIGRKDRGLISRIGEFTPIRLEEGIGTIISIREKGCRFR